MSNIATVRVFAFLRDIRAERGLPATCEVEVPTGGVSAREIARQLGLPLELVEGVFHNGRLFEHDVIVRPGDRIALVPPGTPAFHPAFFGRRRAS
ncbi:MAG: MoaD/ThiS family protein [Coriobacteriia bacterium]